MKFAKFFRTPILKNGDWKIAPGGFPLKKFPPGLGLVLVLGSGAIFQVAIFLVP